MGGSVHTFSKSYTRLVIRFRIYNNFTLRLRHFIITYFIYGVSGKVEIFDFGRETKFFPKVGRGRDLYIIERSVYVYDLFILFIKRLILIFISTSDVQIPGNEISGYSREYSQNRKFIGNILIFINIIHMFQYLIKPIVLIIILQFKFQPKISMYFWV